MVTLTSFFSTSLPSGSKSAFSWVSCLRRSAADAALPVPLLVVAVPRTRRPAAQRLVVVHRRERATAFHGRRRIVMCFFIVVFFVRKAEVRGRRSQGDRTVESVRTANPTPKAHNIQCSIMRDITDISHVYKYT